MIFHLYLIFTSIGIRTTIEKVSWNWIRDWIRKFEKKNLNKNIKLERRENTIHVKICKMLFFHFIDSVWLFFSSYFDVESKSLRKFFIWKRLFRFFSLIIHESHEYTVKNIGKFSYYVLGNFSLILRKHRFSYTESGNIS